MLDDRAIIWIERTQGSGQNMENMFRYNVSRHRVDNPSLKRVKMATSLEKLVPSVEEALRSFTQRSSLLIYSFIGRN